MLGEWRQEQKRVTEDEMVGWHYQLKDMTLSKLLQDKNFLYLGHEIGKDLEAWYAAIHGMAKNQTQLND